MKNERRITANNSGQFSKEIMTFDERNHSAEYYQVRVGNYGIVLPETLNLDTMDGLKLVKDKATRIESWDLALRVAKETEGTAFVITEQFTRVITEFKFNGFEA